MHLIKQSYKPVTDSNVKAIIRYQDNLVLMQLMMTPSSLSRLLVILYQDFLGNFSFWGWFAIAFPF
jgi:hypothetical protein